MNSIITEQVSNIVESARIKLFLEKSTTVYNADDCKITRKYGVVDHRGIYNACVKIEGYEKPFRGRSEILIFKDNKLLINKKNSENKYYSKFPGGGWNENEDPLDAAKREAKEEVRINVKNVKFVGTYFQYSDKMVAKWVRENIPEKDWWYGYYTMVYIGEYDSKYSGKIKEDDKDDMIETVDFVDINDCYSNLASYHKKAVNVYLGKSKTH